MIKVSQGKGEPYCLIVEWLESKSKQPRYVNYLMNEGILYKRSWDRKRKLLCIPPNMVNQILRIHHNDGLSGYLGVNKTYDHLRQRYISLIEKESRRLC